MPPFSSSIAPSFVAPSKRSDANIVTLNVGGQIFQTTPQTLTLAGPTSILSDPPPFIDRDPNLFSLLLSLLRTNRLPSSSSNFSVLDLIAEADFYGIDSSLLSSSPHFDALDLSKSMALPINGRDFPTAVSTDGSGAVHVAHGGKITSFDWSLSKRSTVLTRFPAVDSLLAIDRSIVAAGAVDFPGLQILDLAARSGRKTPALTLNWDVNGSAAAVQGIGLSPEYLFGSFESVRRNSSAVVVFDRTNFKKVGEIGWKEVYGAELDSAIPPTKLKWVNGFNLLLASGSHAGPSGLTGNIRLWDVRSGAVVWEVTEKEDCFADVAVSESLSAIFKVGVNSGEVFMRDLRRLSSSNREEDWVCMHGNKVVDANANKKKKEGSGCLVECHGDKVFVSRGGDVEIWSEVLMGSGMRKNEDDGVGSGERVMRKNHMGRREDVGGKKIVRLGFGGSRMVVLRKEEQCVEVWDTSSSRG